MGKEKSPLVFAIATYALKKKGGMHEFEKSPITFCFHFVPFTSSIFFETQYDKQELLINLKGIKKHKIFKQ